MAKTLKARHWAFVAYPESVSPNWIERLKLSGLKCAISPLHDKDEHSDPSVEDGKKPHWHVIVSWGNTTTWSTVKSLTDDLNATIPIKLESVRGYYRYFTHMEDPDKYQYDQKDIQHLGGFDPLEFIEITMGEKLRILGEIQDLIDHNNILEYSRLCNILKQSEMTEHWAVAITNTLFLNTYITSRRNEKQTESLT